MHLQQGVGRAGFRLLASMFFLVGASGLAVAWAASTVEVSLVFLNIGLAMAAAGMLLLLGAALIASFPGLVDVLPAFEASTSPSHGPADDLEKAGATEPTRSIDFEYPDVEPAARAAPERLVVPSAFQDNKPPAAEVPRTAGPGEADARPSPATPRREAPRRPTPREGAADPSAWPRGDGRAPAWNPPRPRDPVRPEARDEMRERYTQNTPTVRSVLSSAKPAKRDEWDDDVPRVHAQRAPDDVDNDWLEDGQTIGRCGGCKTRVFAPTSRPVVIVCPECEREKLLE